MNFKCLSCASKISLLASWVSGKRNLTCPACHSKQTLDKEQYLKYARLNGALVGGLSTAAALWLFPDYSLFGKFLVLLLSAASISTLVLFIYANRVQVNKSDV